MLSSIRNIFKSNEKEITSSKQSFSNCQELKECIGKCIRIGLTRYADDCFSEENYDMDYRGLHDFILNKEVSGKLLSISDMPDNRNRFCLEIEMDASPLEKIKKVSKYWMSESELRVVNHCALKNKFEIEIYS